MKTGYGHGVMPVAFIEVCLSTSCIFGIVTKPPLRCDPYALQLLPVGAAALIVSILCDAQINVGKITRCEKRELFGNKRELARLVGNSVGSEPANGSCG